VRNKCQRLQSAKPLCFQGYSPQGATHPLNVGTWRPLNVSWCLCNPFTRVAEIGWLQIWWLQISPCQQCSITSW
jgi:hypothetical protein